MLPEVAGLGRFEAVSFAVVSVMIMVKKDIVFGSLHLHLLNAYWKPVFYMFHATLVYSISSTILFLKLFPSKKAFSNVNNVCHTWLVFSHILSDKAAFDCAVYTWLLEGLFILGLIHTFDLLCV